MCFSSLEDGLLAVLAEGPCTAAELARALGARRAAVRRALDALEADELVAADPASLGEPRWRLRAWVTVHVAPAIVTVRRPFTAPPSQLGAEREGPDGELLRLEMVLTGLPARVLYALGGFWKATEDIAERADADPALVRRLLRALEADGLAEEQVEEGGACTWNVAPGVNPMLREDGAVEAWKEPPEPPAPPEVRCRSDTPVKGRCTLPMLPDGNGLCWAHAYMWKQDQEA